MALGGGPLDRLLGSGMDDLAVAHDARARDDLVFEVQREL